MPAEVNYLAFHEVMGDKVADDAKALIKDCYSAYQINLNEAISFLELAKSCESPIEALLFWEIQKRWGLSVDGCGGACSLQELIDDLVIDIRLQHHVSIQTSKSDEPVQFRIDFYIAFHLYNSSDNRSFGLCIELDGHEFHEKTKQQAQRDKLKDRLLQRAGYQVLRYTGAEVYRSAAKVLSDIEDHIKSLLETTPNG